MTRLLSQLSIEIGLREADVRQIMHTAPSRYKHFKIPKRSGGWRLISQPAREVKAVQRALIELLLLKLPVHPSATAYRSGQSIRDNVLPHVNNGPILKMDFKDFFPSIKPLDWQHYCNAKGISLDHEEIGLTSSLLFHRLPSSSLIRLAIGAPSSPILSNILMFDFDETITNELIKDRVTYTRYADDMTFSAPRTGFLNSVQKTVRSTLRTQTFPTLYINDDKTVEATKKYKRFVTGLVISNEGMVTIGKAKKRSLHAAVHSASHGKLSAPEMQRLSGYLSYVNSVEPEFIVVLRRRYGDDTVNRLFSFVFRQRLTSG